jgi:hypothetical protein
MDPLWESAETYGPPSQKNVLNAKIETVRVIEVNKHICSQEAINYFIA